jgi:hypothetical protein
MTTSNSMRVKALAEVPGKVPLSSDLETVIIPLIGRRASLLQSIMIYSTAFGKLYLINFFKTVASLPVATSLESTSPPAPQVAAPI